MDKVKVCDAIREISNYCKTEDCVSCIFNPEHDTCPFSESPESWPSFRSKEEKDEAIYI